MIRGFIAGLVLLAASAVASAADRAIIILDGSGSMWGQIDGRPKLEIARETLRQVLRDAPPTLELGLMAYGHREKGNCSDIELLVPPGPDNASAIASAADHLQFLGKTPLTEAVRQAAGDLRYTEDRATVILITDGIETCEADPCALAGELERAGVDFTIHVVGFGLSREEGRQVACLAEETGGKYIQAQNAGQLSSALALAVATSITTQQPAAPSAPPMPLPPATVAVSGTASIGAGISVDWTGPADDGDYIDIVPSGFGETSGELAYAYVRAGTSPLQINAPGQPGTYDLRYVWQGPDGRHVLTSIALDVRDSDVAIIAPAGVVAGSTMTVEWKGPATDTDYLDIVPAGYTDTSGELSYAYTAGGNPATMKAPGDAGSYELRYVLQGPDGRRVLTSVPLTVTEAVASLAFPPEVSGGTQITVFWKGPKGQGDYLDLVPEGQTEASGELAYFYVESSGDENTGDFVAPGKPGSYQIRYILNASDGRRVLTSQPLRVTPPTATLAVTDVVEAGTTFGVDWTGPNAPRDYIDLVPEGQVEPQNELAYAYTVNAAGLDQKSARSEMTAPDQPGRYDVRYILDAADGRMVLARRTIEVR